MALHTKYVLPIFMHLTRFLSFVFRTWSLLKSSLFSDLKQKGFAYCDAGEFGYSRSFPWGIFLSFFHFTLLFWNHIFTCFSVRSSMAAIWILRSLDRYLLFWNSFSSSRSWILVYAVRIRFDFPHCIWAFSLRFSSSLTKRRTSMIIFKSIKDHIHHLHMNIRSDGN